MSDQAQAMAGKVKSWLLKTKLSSPKFKIKGTEFVISKIPPMQSFDVAEFIRFNLAKSADSFSIDDKSSETDNAILFFKAVLGLDPAVVAHIREELFAYIEFTGSGVEKGYMPLAGAEDMAFQNFEVVHVYEVIGRALFINFFGSFAGIASAFPGAESFIKSHLPKT
ncbi:MAG: hypothetical protein KAR40_13880 [Candidatus Sabulitectum sp.]|nr:hypothetical protein [Candidatus Sabulitectum sp.]